ncbi:hypothetical protein ACFU76_29495 [Streptomyces sp. NPDC057539]|uniref:hypothetical protein n=1 Tax=Streptomyces sp. NPDC057539 TaxID=3346159 RepID=UPI0036CBEF7D
MPDQEVASVGQPGGPAAKGAAMARARLPVEEDGCFVAEDRGRPLRSEAGKEPFLAGGEWCQGLIDVNDETEIWGVKIFALMERVMGTTVHPSWFTEPLDTFTVPPASGYADTPAWDVP